MQLTAQLKVCDAVDGLAVAENCCCAVRATSAVFGAIVTLTFTTSTFTVADLFVSALDVALTVTGAVGGVAGAVYRPAVEIAPQSVPVHPVLERLHVTEVSVDPLTDAVNCCVIVTATATALLGVSETWTPPLLVESPPPQPASKSRLRDTRNA